MCDVHNISNDVCETFINSLISSANELNLTRPIRDFHAKNTLGICDYYKNLIQANFGHLTPEQKLKFSDALKTIRTKCRRYKQS